MNDTVKLCNSIEYAIYYLWSKIRPFNICDEATADLYGEEKSF